MLQQSNAVKLQKNVVDYKASPFRRDEGEWTTTEFSFWGELNLSF